MTILKKQPAPRTAQAWEDHHEAASMPVRWQARSMGVYRVAIFTWTEDDSPGWYRSRGYVFMARTKRWTRLMTDRNRAPPRLTRTEAEADYKAQRAADRAVPLTL